MLKVRTRRINQLDVIRLVFELARTFKSDDRPRAQLTNKIMAAVPKPTNMIACQLTKKTDGALHSPPKSFKPFY